MLLAIDPGNVQSAWCEIRYSDYAIIDKNKADNADVLREIERGAEHIEHIAIEMIASYGMPVGAEVFETCAMIGRIEQLADMLGISHSRVFRAEEKLCICHDSRAKDNNIRQALIDRFAKHDKKRGTGTKARPDWFYGVSKDIWSAYAVGVVYLDGINGLFNRKGDA